MNATTELRLLLNESQSQIVDSSWKEVEHFQPFILSLRKGDYTIRLRLWRGQYNLYVSHFKGKGVWESVREFQTFDKDEAFKEVEKAKSDFS